MKGELEKLLSLSGIAFLIHLVLEGTVAIHHQIRLAFVVLGFCDPITFKITLHSLEKMLRSAGTISSLIFRTNRPEIKVVVNREVVSQTL